MNSRSAPTSVDALLRLRRIDYALDPQDINASCLRLVRELSGWKGVTVCDVHFTRFTEGITNTLVKASPHKRKFSEAEVDKSAVLIRAYGAGTDGIIDREKELRAHDLLASNRLAPQLLGRFSNGFMYSFVPGRPCTVQDFHDASISRMIAIRLGQWHGKLPICVLGDRGVAQPNETKDDQIVPNIWSNARQWIKFLPSDTEDLRGRNELFYKELDWIESLFKDTSGLNGQDYVFSHTDLLCANVILTEPRNKPLQGDPAITFIDYEYATPAPAAFDIANFFAEWAGPDQEYSWMPSQSDRLAFIEHYVESFRSSSGSSALSQHSGDVTQLYNQVERFRGVPGLYWGIWGLCQASISEIDFDYIVYAERRHSEYWGWKAEYTGSRQRDGKRQTIREKAWARM